MSLKDFSFKQLDKTAKLSVGKVEKKFDEKAPVARTNCRMTRSCTSFRQG